ncbi:hypothetical protein FLA105534_00768 [Flavobacterium bizetiae]|nr:hypothetical protein FLA105534_00768 [Flavobacterium bizetiae]
MWIMFVTEHIKLKIEKIIFREDDINSLFFDCFPIFIKESKKIVFSLISKD